MLIGMLDSKSFKLSILFGIYILSTLIIFTVTGIVSMDVGLLTLVNFFLNPIIAFYWASKSFDKYFGGRFYTLKTTLLVFFKYLLIHVLFLVGVLALLFFLSYSLKQFGLSGNIPLSSCFICSENRSANPVSQLGSFLPILASSMVFVLVTALIQKSKNH